MTTSGNSAADGDHADVIGRLMPAPSADDLARADAHLAGCTDCRAEIELLREWSDALTDAPAAMLSDGPPEGGDLVLQASLRRVRSDARRGQMRRTAAGVAAAVVIAGAAFAAGTLMSGDVTDPVAQAVPSPSTARTLPAADRSGARTAAAQDPVTGAQMSVAVMPAAGWVRVHAVVSGIPAGERCILEVIARDGTAAPAGSWLVSEDAAADGTDLDGSALIDPAEVTAVRVVSTAGQGFVRVPM